MSADYPAFTEPLRPGILDRLPQIIYVFDLQARRTAYLSPQTWEVLGIRPETLMASSPLGLFSRVHPDDAAELAINQVPTVPLDDAAVIRREFRLQDSGGRWRWFHEQTAVFQRLPSGDVGQLIGVVEEVTARRAESEIRRLQAEVEQRVRERTEALRRRAEEAELLNRGMVNLLEDLQETRVTAEQAARRLEETNTQLDEANRELEAFSYSVSHDLRAPLRNVTGFVDLLTRSPEATDEATQHYLEIIGQETRRMDELINDLLEFSRIVRTEMSRQPVDMAALALAAWKDLEPDRAGRSVQWELAALPAATGDARLLRLVWTNLLSNALKYSRPRQPAIIRVGTRPASSPGTIEYAVEDNGVGFDMKYVGKLFGVFQRLHPAAEFEGTGIGLANVQRILRRHGGRAWAESRPGAGATFYFSLPVDPP